MFNLLLYICVIFACKKSVDCLIDGLYCGQHDCYSVLDVPTDASKAAIAKAYRQLAMKYHPDRHKTEDSKQKAADKFTLISTAYEILKDEETRKDYDYMLSNPDKVYGHYYRYYKRSLTPKVDARIVIAVTVTVISVLQYLAAWSRYRWAINYLITIPRYRIKALEIAKQEKLLETSRKKDRKSKEQIKEEEDAVLKKIMEDRVDIRGGYSKPSIKDILWIQLLFLPYTIMKYIYWNMRWLWKFHIMKEEYGEEEKFYLIRKYLQCSKTQWDAVPDEEKKMFLEEKLWIKENILKLKKQ